MYTTIRRYRTDPAKVAEIADKVRAGLVPILQGISGFLGYYVVDGGDGTVASISVFETEAAAQESTSKAASWVQDNVADYVIEGPQVTAGPTIISTD